MKIKIPDLKTGSLPKLICITTMEDKAQGRAVYSVKMEDGHYENFVMSSSNESVFLYGYDLATRHYNEDVQEWFKELLESDEDE